MAKGQFGARDLQKQLWKLPIPEYDATEALHGRSRRWVRRRLRGRRGSWGGCGRTVATM